MQCQYFLVALLLIATQWIVASSQRLALQSATSRTLNSQPSEEGDGSIPHIIHHMHASLSTLSPTEARLRKRCMELHPDWKFVFWNDADLDTFIKSAFPTYYDTWQEIQPQIKKLDTSRYMLMHHFGGIYLDVDVECVTPFDSLTAPLPRHAAWVGDYPEPMFLMSSPKNAFWLYALERIRRVWRHHDAWHSTGPQGVNSALVDWVRRHGSGSLVPFITQRTEPEFHVYIKNKNNTVPWYELSDRRMRLEDAGPGWQHPSIWYSSTGKQRLASGGEEAMRKLPSFPATDPATVPVSNRVGLLANELLDPPGCEHGQLMHCKESFCNATWPLAYVVHHCMSTWRGRIGDARRSMSMLRGD